MMNIIHVESVKEQGEQELWLPPGVLALIGAHLDLENRIILSSTCKAWRRALHAGVGVLTHSLDDCTTPAARCHTATGWAGMLATLAALSPTERAARLRAAGNLMDAGSLGTMLGGLAAHTQLTGLELTQLPHDFSLKLPSKPPPLGSRLRRRGRTAKPPRTVFPRFDAAVLPPLCFTLTGLRSLSLRNCLLVPGFESQLSRLTALTRLVLVPSQEGEPAVYGYYMPQQWFLHSTALAPLGPSLHSLTLGGQLMTPASLALLAPSLTGLRTLRLEALSAWEHSQRRTPAVLALVREEEAGAGMEAGGRVQPPDLAATLRDCFTQLTHLQIQLYERCSYISLSSELGVPLMELLQSLRGLRGLALRVSAHPDMGPLPPAASRLLSKLFSLDHPVHPTAARAVEALE